MGRSVTVVRGGKDTWSSVTTKWHKRLKKERTPGVCGLKGCTAKTDAPKRRLCQEHKRELLREQNQVAMLRHRERKKAGLTGHYRTYRGKKPKTLRTAKKAA